MTSDRSSDTPVSDEPASWADGTGGDGRELPPSRGILGRILGAFGSGENDNDNGVRAEDARSLSAAAAAPGILNLSRLRVDDVAVPKAEMIAAPIDIELPDLVEMFREHGFSRVPVYRGTLDQPLGMIHLKDLSLKYGFGAQAPAFALRPMLRPLLYVPPSMPIGVLLQQMQQKRIHMALVIDEYGGVDGLVTIEDLIEQVLGQIEDEHDEDEGDLWLAEGPGQWLIQARTALEDVEKLTGVSLVEDAEEEDVDTLGGLIFMHTGRVPVEGETIQLDNGIEIEVVDADPRRVKRVRLRVPSSEAEPSGE